MSEKKSSKDLFNKSLKKLENQEIKRKAFRIAMGGFIEQGLDTVFKKTTYEDVFEKGIYRRENDKLIHLTGDQAVFAQIKSFDAQASPVYEKNSFIENYVGAIKKIGVSSAIYDSIFYLLKNTSVEKLTVLIERGILPDIQFIYANSEDIEDNGQELLEDVKNALDKGISKEELSRINKKSKQNIEHVRGLGGFNEKLY